MRKYPMTQDFTIRALRQGDLAAAAEIIAAVDLFPPEMLDEMAGPGLSGTAPDLWLFAGGGGGLAYAAPERLTDGTWNLLALAVAPERQGQGLGRALVTAVETAVKARGGRLLLVETSGTAGFSGTRAFYAKLGFRREARIRDYYGAGEDKVIYTRALALR
jgi:ribosomal protein S18 acetylase RimI-like enzyme